MASNPDSLGPSPDPVAFNTVADLVAAFTAPAGSCAGRIARQVICMSDGAIQIKTASNPTLREWVFKANVPECAQFTGFAASAGSAVVPSSTAPIKVYF